MAAKLSIGKKKLLVLVLSMLLLSWALAIYQFNKPTVAQTTPTMRNFFVAVKYDFAGSGYNVFWPQTLVVQQGDQVNITIRNIGNASFQFSLQGQKSITISGGSQNDSTILPVDTAIPVFTASNAGIYLFSTDKFPEMNGELVVLPSDTTEYNPSTQTRSFTQIVMPDFSGDGYDKFIPGVMVVNLGDTINVTIRNTDDMVHGFAIAAYDLNIAVDPGQDQPDGSILPVDTVIQSFTASKAGVFRWFCTNPCGPGHFEMVGQLVVLPTQNTAYSPDTTTVYSYFTIKPNFTGVGYSKCMPDIVFANQNDFVYIKVRNTDVNAYNFSMPGYSVNNLTISAGNFSQPSQTYIPNSSLFANQAGVFEFAYSSTSTSEPNGQMNGYLVILPTANVTSGSPTPTTSISGPPIFYVELSIAMVIIGIVIGAIVAAIVGTEKQSKNNS